MPDGKIDLDDKLLQQASVDYLNQINRNVIALNATATSQKDITERQLQVQDNTRALIDEQKQTLSARIQNQAYMTYGTVQHDMKNLVGVTDESARVAMTTMRIAGGNIIDDVRAVSGRAVDMTASGLVRAQQIMDPGPVVEQGFIGSVIGGLGLRKAPSTMYNEDYIRSSGEQALETVSNIGYQFRGLGFRDKWTEKLSRERLLEFMAPRIIRPGMVGGEFQRGGRFTEEQREAIGTAIYNIEDDLQRGGIQEDEARRLVMMAGRAEFGAVGRRETGEAGIDEMLQNIRKFTEEATKMAKMFNMSAEDMARNLADLRQLTGMDPDQAGAFMTRTRARGAALGLTGQESLSAARGGIQVARNYGISFEAGQRRFFQTLGDVRERAGQDQDYREFVFRQGGPEAVAQQDINQNVAFRRSNLGLFYTMARQSGADITPETSLMQVQAAAAQTAAGGPGAVFRSIWRQMTGGDEGARGFQRNIYLQMFKTTHQDAKVTDVKKGGKYSDDFMGFLAVRLGTRDPDRVKRLYYNLFKETYDFSKVSQAYEQETAQLEKEDVEKRTTGFFATLRGIGRAITQGGQFEGDRSRPARASEEPKMPTESIRGAGAETPEQPTRTIIPKTTPQGIRQIEESPKIATPVTVPQRAVQNVANITSASDVTEPYGSTETVSSVSQEDKSLADAMMKAVQTLKDSVQMLADISQNIHSAWANKVGSGG
jgi:hypothetical protein